MRASRLPVAPVLRRRLWWMPLNMANPAWVDAEPDLRQHIVEVRLPASARHGDGLAELQAEVGRLHPVLLDRHRPLWKFHVFEGLAPGANGRRRVAMYSQLHHAAVDGQAAVALANATLDTTPVPRPIETRPSRRERTFEIGMSEMLRGVLGSQAQKVAQIIRELPGTVGTLGSAAGQAASRGAELLGVAAGKGKGSTVSNIALAPRTPFNASVTDGRRFAAVTLPLAEVKALGRAGEATINDVVLWLVSSALRRYLAKRQALPRKSLIAAVPISLREKGDTSSDNQASMSLVNLGTNIADPRRRLTHVKAASAAMKSAMGPLKSILPTDFPSLGVPWLLEAATALYGKARVAERLPQVANVVVSNVPGPPLPLYLAGAHMLTNYPTSIVVHGVALNITVQSYDQSLDFGLMADAQAAPDVAALAEGLRVAMDDLRVLVGAEEADRAVGGRRRHRPRQPTTRRVRAAVDGAGPRQQTGGRRRRRGVCARHDERNDERAHRWRGQERRQGLLAERAVTEVVGGARSASRGIVGAAGSPMAGAAGAARGATQAMQAMRSPPPKARKVTAKAPGKSARRRPAQRQGRGRGGAQGRGRGGAQGDTQDRRFDRGTAGCRDPANSHPQTWGDLPSPRPPTHSKMSS
ncbi:MAG: wax ester/triacylglycerol synthase family O-acyltransferase [Rubrivivax sp.]